MIKNIFKKLNAKYYLTICIALINLISLILYIVSVSTTVSQEVNVIMNTQVLILLIVAIVFEVICGSLALFIKCKTIIDYAFLVEAILLTIALMIILNDRIYSIGILLGSDLYATDKQAYTQLYIALSSIGVLFASIILNCVTGFMSYIKK